VSVPISETRNVFGQAEYLEFQVAVGQLATPLRRRSDDVPTEVHTSRGQSF
jgi:hypothetical protein